MTNLTMLRRDVMDHRYKSYSIDCTTMLSIIDELVAARKTIADRTELDRLRGIDPVPALEKS